MAMKDLFEGSQVTLKGKVKRGRSRTIKFHVNFSDEIDGKNQLEIEKSGSAIFDTTISQKYELPDVPDGREYYLMTWGAEAEGIKGIKWSPDVIQVWPRTMTLEAVDDQGAKVEGFPFRFRQGMELVEARATDAEGMSSFDLTDPGPVRQIIPIAPWETIGNPTQDGRKWEATVRKKPYTATFYSPNIANDWKDDDGQLKQYVNLSGADANLGNIIRFKICPKAENGTKDQDLGMKGDSLYIQFIPDDGNCERDTPRPTLQTPGSIAKEGNTFKSKVEVPDDGELVEFALDLGLAGGDKFELKIGVTESCEDESIKIITWRKLFYKAMVPEFIKDDIGAEDLPAATTNYINGEKALKSAFVEFSLKQWINFAKVDCGADYVFKAAFFKRAGRDLYILPPGGLNPPPKPFGASDERTVDIQLCDIGISWTNEGYETIRPRISALDGANAYTFDTITNKRKYCLPKALAIARKQTAPGTYTVTAAKGSDGVDKSAGTWTALPPNNQPNHPGRENDGKAKSGNLDDWTIEVSDFRTVKITPPVAVQNLIGASSNTKCPVKIKIKFLTCHGHLGTSGGGRQVLVYDKSGPETMASTLCHELGHSMGMTIVPAGNMSPPGLEQPKHVDDKTKGPYYVNGLPLFSGGKRGLHVGPHCAWGIPEKDWKHKTFNGKPGKCIMFGAGGNNAEDKEKKYCDICVTYLKARNLKDIRTSFRSGARDPKEA